VPFGRSPGTNTAQYFMLICEAVARSYANLSRRRADSP
jgi:hypothetical protein